MPNPYGSRPSSMAKSPIVAAILNLFWGLGYWYLGFRRVLSIPTLWFVIIMIIVYIVFGYFSAGILPLIFAILMAIDGYQKGLGQRGFIPVEI
jgi:phosphoglycerol transferase MdoB-like AlkP superfamily enzyme